MLKIQHKNFNKNRF